MLQNELSILHVKSHEMILEERQMRTKENKEARDSLVQSKEYFDLILNLESESSALPPGKSI